MDRRLLLYRGEAEEDAAEGEDEEVSAKCHTGARESSFGHSATMPKGDSPPLPPEKAAAAENCGTSAAPIVRRSEAFGGMGIPSTNPMPSPPAAAPSGPTTAAPPKELCETAMGCAVRRKSQTRTVPLA